MFKNEWEAISDNWIYGKNPTSLYILKKWKLVTLLLMIIPVNQILLFLSLYQNCYQTEKYEKDKLFISFHYAKYDKFTCFFFKFYKKK